MIGIALCVFIMEDYIHQFNIVQGCNRFQPTRMRGIPVLFVRVFVSELPKLPDTNCLFNQFSNQKLLSPKCVHSGLHRLSYRPI